MDIKTSKVSAGNYKIEIGGAIWHVEKREPARGTDGWKISKMDWSAFCSSKFPQTHIRCDTFREAKNDIISWMEGKIDCWNASVISQYSK